MTQYNKLFYRVLMIFVLVVIGCGVFKPQQTTETTDADFNLVFKYGVGSRNELNTFEQTFTKDMIIDPPITIALSLTKNELDKIYQKMTEINFFDYPDTFSVFLDSEEGGFFIPYPTYYFRVEYNSNIKELLWHDNILTEDEKATKLRELFKFIRNIIESKEEYKELPPAQGGYL